MFFQANVLAVISSLVTLTENNKPFLSNHYQGREKPQVDTYNKALSLLNTPLPQEMAQFFSFCRLGIKRLLKESVLQPINKDWMKQTVLKPIDKSWLSQSVLAQYRKKRKSRHGKGMSAFNSPLELNQI